MYTFNEVKSQLNFEYCLLDNPNFVDFIKELNTKRAVMEYLNYNPTKKDLTFSDIASPQFIDDFYYFLEDKNHHINSSIGGYEADKDYYFILEFLAFFYSSKQTINYIKANFEDIEDYFEFYDEALYLDYNSAASKDFKKLLKVKPFNLININPNTKE